MVVFIPPVGREQIVDVNGLVSKLCKITCGVPQGSIMGLMLFLLYVNDMKCVKNYRI